MPDRSSERGAPVPAEHAEIVPRLEPGIDPGGGAGDRQERVEHPAKVMRIGSMIKQLLDEVRSASLDDAGRVRLREIYDTSISELGQALSPDLSGELGRLAPPFASESTPSEAELRVAQAQLVGWLEGLFHGIQATLFAQQMAARQQLEQMSRGLPPGQRPGPDGGGSDSPGTYL